MNQKKKFLDHYFRMYEVSEFDGLKSVVKEERNELKRHLLLANIPRNYFDYGINEVIDAWSNDVANDESIENYSLYLENLETARNNGTGLFINGTHGLAKTTAAVVILQEAIKKKMTCYFISMNDLVDFVTSGWKDYNLKIKYQYIVTNVDFLVVDDIGRNYQINSNQHTQFFDKLFVTRCNQKKSTILTSNHSLGSGTAIFTESLLTLLKSSLIEIQLVGKDIREEKSKKLIEQLRKNKKGKMGKKGKQIG